MKIKFFCSLLISILFSACISHTAYQTGRTLGKGKSEITMALNGTLAFNEESEDI